DLHIPVDVMLDDVSLRYGCSSLLSGTPALNNMERSGMLFNGWTLPRFPRLHSKLLSKIPTTIYHKSSIRNRAGSVLLN
ncbi:MAG: hypothetical protein U9P90_02760, partial [Patescibacteria group bacterium]|nr:hypothetical protein [Patescibacteria group bacterium]